MYRYTVWIAALTSTIALWTVLGPTYGCFMIFCMMSGHSANIQFTLQCWLKLPTMYMDSIILVDSNLKLSEYKVVNL